MERSEHKFIGRTYPDGTVGVKFAHISYVTYVP